jgi:hypothetical protein
MFRLLVTHPVGGPELTQELRGEHRATPRAKVLCRDALTGDRAQILIDMAGLDDSVNTALVDVLE